MPPIYEERSKAVMQLLTEISHLKAISGGGYIHEEYVTEQSILNACREVALLSGAIFGGFGSLIGNHFGFGALQGGIVGTLAGLYLGYYYNNYYGQTPNTLMQVYVEPTSIDYI